MPAKQDLRKACLDRRNRLTETQIRDKSARIRERLYGLHEYGTAHEVLVYASKKYEVDTRPILQELLDSGRPLLVPIAREDGTLDWSCLDKLDDLSPGAFGVPEPVPERRRAATPRADALVIVPCVGFSSSGHRMGYGRGFFDRFLQGHAGPKVGLAFAIQRAEGLRPEPHDVPLDAIITEERVYRPGAHA